MHSIRHDYKRIKKALEHLSNRIQTFKEISMALIDDVQTELDNARAIISQHESDRDAQDSANQTAIQTLTQANIDLQTEIAALQTAGSDVSKLQNILQGLKDLESSVTTPVAGVILSPSSAPPVPVARTAGGAVNPNAPSPESSFLHNPSASEPVIPKNTAATVKKS